MRLYKRAIVICVTMTLILTTAYALPAIPPTFTQHGNEILIPILETTPTGLRHIHLSTLHEALSALNMLPEFKAPTMTHLTNGNASKVIGREKEIELNTGGFSQTTGSIDIEFDIETGSYNPSITKENISNEAKEQYHLELTHIDRKWYQQDREHIDKTRKALKAGEKLQDLLYDEYKLVSKAFARTYNEGYHSQLGYKIFEPKITEKLSILWVAASARSELLKDSQSYSIKWLNNYYPEFEYKFIDYSFPNGHGPLGQLRTKDITITENNKDFDLKAAVKALDNLGIPPYFLKGASLYVVNGEPDVEISAYSTLTPTRGFSDDMIVFFNGEHKESAEDILVHEVGHFVGNEVFYNHDPKTHLSTGENTASLEEYAKIYGKEHEYTAATEWEDLIQENFAEDFAKLTANSPKSTSWLGEQSKANAFIESLLARDYEIDAPIYDGVYVTMNGVRLPYLSLPIDRNQNYFATRGEEIRIDIDGLEFDGELHCVVFDNLDNSIIEAQLDGNSTSLALPEEKGTYEVTIGAMNDSEITPNVACFKVYKIE